MHLKQNAFYRFMFLLRKKEEDKLKEMKKKITERKEKETLF